jgi:DNA polymerase
MMPAPGKSFVVADWSSIEARVTPWCSDCDAGNAKLELFRTGEDVYKVNASATFKKKVGDISNEERQIGKVQELACGFAGGIGAFNAMGRAYGITLSEDESQRMVDGWRRANSWATPYWSDLESTYTRAMRNPNREFSAGRVTYLFDGMHLWYALPSGRILNYPFAKMDGDGVTYAKASWKPAADAKEWPRARLWRGLACENITQAVAADILRYALRELDDLYYDIVLHVHDEIVVETDNPDQAIKDMTRIMTTAPSWAAGLPLGIDIKTMKRYGK